MKVRMKINKKNIEAILQQDERMKYVSLWYDRAAKQWVFVGGDSAMWSTSGTVSYTHLTLPTTPYV